MSQMEKQDTYCSL